MTADRILEQIREGQIQEESLKKYLGGYRTKDVDDYVEKLLNRLHNMETVYQERFEEMRTGLLDMTRERDEQAERANALEQKLTDIPKYCEAYLKENGMVAMPKDQFGHLQNVETVYKEKLDKLKNENEQALAELEKTRSSQKEAEKLAETKKILERIQAQAKAQAEECEELRVQLQKQTKSAKKIQVELEASESQCHKYEAELEQIQIRYHMLEIQSQLTQDMNQQLTREKEQHEKEAARRQERWDNERALLLQRFNGILHSQKQYMQHLQESFASSMQCMEKLGEADFLDLSSAEANK